MDNDPVLAKLLRGISPQDITDGIRLAIEAQQQPQPVQSFQQEMQQTYQSAQAVAPPIHVRVKEVEPPVVLKGTLTFQATFPYESIVGLPLDEVKQRIYRVIFGENDNGAFLPQVVYGDMDVWREVVKSERPADPGPAANPGPAFRRAIYPASAGDDSLDAGHPEHRDAGNDGPSEAGQP